MTKLSLPKSRSVMAIFDKSKESLSVDSILIEELRDSAQIRLEAYKQSLTNYHDKRLDIVILTKWIEY